MEFRTSKELADNLKSFKGSSMCSMELTTIVKANKKGRESGSLFTEKFCGDVYRTYKEAGNFGISYENAVNNERAREGMEKDFVAETLPWGTWYDGGVNKIIEHKGEFYLRYFVNMNANSKSDKEVIYHYENGAELSDEEIDALEEFLPPKSKSNTQGTAKEIEVRCVKINGINSIKVGGEVYSKI